MFERCNREPSYSFLDWTEFREAREYDRIQEEKEIAEARARSTVYAIKIWHTVYFPEKRHVAIGGSGDLGVICDNVPFDDRRDFSDF